MSTATTRRAKRPVHLVLGHRIIDARSMDDLDAGQLYDLTKSTCPFTARLAKAKQQRRYEAKKSLAISRLGISETEFEAINPFSAEYDAMMCEAGL